MTVSRLRQRWDLLSQYTSCLPWISHYTLCVQGFKFEYAEHGDIPLELFWRGMISLTLTAVNILCIIIVGVLMLLVKQVTQNKLP